MTRFIYTDNQRGSGAAAWNGDDSIQYAPSWVSPEIAWLPVTFVAGRGKPRLTKNTCTSHRFSTYILPHLCNATWCTIVWTYNILGQRTSFKERLLSKMPRNMTSQLSEWSPVLALFWDWWINIGHFVFLSAVSVCSRISRGLFIRACEWSNVS